MLLRRDLGCLIFGHRYARRPMLSDTCGYDCVRCGHEIRTNTLLFGWADIAPGWSDVGQVAVNSVSATIRNDRRVFSKGAPDPSR